MLTVIAIHSGPSRSRVTPLRLSRSSVTLLRCFGSAWPDAIIEVTAPSSDVVPASSDRSGVNTPETSTEERLIPGDLTATLAARAPDPGPNPTDWPGLTLYRFTAPTAPQWDQVGALSICVVAQGRKAVTVDGVRHYYDPWTSASSARSTSTPRLPCSR